MKSSSGSLQKPRSRPSTGTNGRIGHVQREDDREHAGEVHCVDGVPAADAGQRGILGDRHRVRVVVVPEFRVIGAVSQRTDPKCRLRLSLKNYDDITKKCSDLKSSLSLGDGDCRSTPPPRLTSGSPPVQLQAEGKRRDKISANRPPELWRAQTYPMRTGGGSCLIEEKPGSRGRTGIPHVSKHETLLRPAQSCASRCAAGWRREAGACQLSRFRAPRRRGESVSPR